MKQKKTELVEKIEYLKKENERLQIKIDSQNEEIRQLKYTVERRRKIIRAYADV